jgi:hypothetical protein
MEFLDNLLDSLTIYWTSLGICFWYLLRFPDSEAEWLHCYQLELHAVVLKQHQLLSIRNLWRYFRIYIRYTFRYNKDPSSWAQCQGPNDLLVCVQQLSVSIIVVFAAMAFKLLWHSRGRKPQALIGLVSSPVQTNRLKWGTK